MGRGRHHGDRGGPASPGDQAIRTDEETIELVRRLAEHYDDATIARHLARQNRATATGLAFTKDRVAHLRRTRAIPGPDAPEAVSPTRDDADNMVGITQAQAALGVSRATVHRWLAEGFIAGEQDVPGGPWRVRVDADMRARVVPEIPEGWVGLADAAKTMGIARQTVLDRVRRGEIEAVHVNRGRRSGLAIRIPRPANVLFAD